MDPILRVILVIGGAALGSFPASNGREPLAAIVGALVGLAIGEVAYLRNALAELRTGLWRISCRASSRQ